MTTRAGAGLEAHPGFPEAGAVEESARTLARLLPAPVAALFGTAFIRSSHLYEEFVSRLALQVFRDAGLAEAAREAGGPEEIAARAGLEPARALTPLRWILRRLAERGLLERSGADAFRLHEAPSELDPASIREAQRALDASWLPSYVLAEQVARDYPTFLRGARSGEEILFSPARLRLWAEFFSNDNGLYAVNNALGAFAAHAWMPRGRAAILEIGGGLGSAAVALLEELRAASRWEEIDAYRFTELVPAFLRRGHQALRARLGDAPFLTAAPLDMNLPFGEQGVAPGSVSLVYAVNTVHVARRLDVTLRSIFDALRPGGRLILSECVRPRPGALVYVEFVFNLLETFRAPELHPRYRPSGGFLTPPQWRDALEAAGFVDVRTLPDGADFWARFPGFYVAAIGATRP